MNMKGKTINLPIQIQLEMSEFGKDMAPIDVMTKVDKALGKHHHQFSYVGITLILNYADEFGNMVVGYYKEHETKVDENKYLVHYSLLGIARDGAKLKVNPELVEGPEKAGGFSLGAIPPHNLN